MKIRNGRFILTDDIEAVETDFVESMLRTSYWASGRPRSIIEESIKNSINFSLLDGLKQIGYARVVSDLVTFAWIADVVVSPESVASTT